MNDCCERIEKQRWKLNCKKRTHAGETMQTQAIHFNLHAFIVPSSDSDIGASGDLVRCSSHGNLFDCLALLNRRLGAVNLDASLEISSVFDADS